MWRATVACICPQVKNGWEEPPKGANAGAWTSENFKYLESNQYCTENLHCIVKQETIIKMSNVPTQRSRSSKPAQLPTVVSLFRCHLSARNQLRSVHEIILRRFKICLRLIFVISSRRRSPLIRETTRWWWRRRRRSERWILSSYGCEANSKSQELIKKKNFVPYHVAS